VLSGDRIYVNSLESTLGNPPGEGARAIYQLLPLIDRKGITILMEPEAFGHERLSQSRLERMYKLLGFKVGTNWNTGEEVWIRLPRDVLDAYSEDIPILPSGKRFLGRVWYRDGEFDDYSEFTFDPRPGRNMPAMSGSRGTGFASGQYSYGEYKPGRIPVPAAENPLEVGRIGGDVSAGDFLNDAISLMRFAEGSTSGYAGITMSNLSFRMFKYAPEGSTIDETLEDIEEAIRIWKIHHEVHPMNILLSRWGHDGIEFVDDAAWRANAGSFGNVKFPPMDVDGKVLLRFKDDVSRYMVPDRTTSLGTFGDELRSIMEGTHEKGWIVVSTRPVAESAGFVTRSLGNSHIMIMRKGDTFDIEYEALNRIFERFDRGEVSDEVIIGVNKALGLTDGQIGAKLIELKETRLNTPMKIFPPATIDQLPLDLPEDATEYLKDFQKLGSDILGKPLTRLIEKTEFTLEKANDGSVVITNIFVKGNLSIDQQSTEIFVSLESIVDIAKSHRTTLKVAAFRKGMSRQDVDKYEKTFEYYGFIKGKRISPDGARFPVYEYVLKPGISAPISRVPVVRAMDLLKTAAEMGDEITRICKFTRGIDPKVLDLPIENLRVILRVLEDEMSRSPMSISGVIPNTSGRRVYAAYNHHTRELLLNLELFEKIGGGNVGHHLEGYALTIDDEIRSIRKDMQYKIKGLSPEAAAKALDLLERRLDYLQGLIDQGILHTTPPGARHWIRRFTAIPGYESDRDTIAWSVMQHEIGHNRFWNELPSSVRDDYLKKYLQALNKGEITFVSDYCGHVAPGTPPGSEHFSECYMMYRAYVATKDTRYLAEIPKITLDLIKSLEP
jgi:hypothetical protein